MIGFSIILDGENAWPDLAEKRATKQLHHVTEGIAVAVLDGGMASGKPSVAFRIDLPNGESVIVETSAALFVSASEAIKARHPGVLS